MRSLGATRAGGALGSFSAKRPSSVDGISRRNGRRIFAGASLVGTVAETISSLYVLLSVQQIVVAPWIWLSALLPRLRVCARRGLAAGRAASRAVTIRCKRCMGAFASVRSVHLSRGWISPASFSLPSRRLFFSADRRPLRTGPPWLGFGAAFCSGRRFPARAGNYLAFQPRDSIDRASTDRAATRGAKSRARAAAQFGHDRIARRGGRDDRGRGGDGIFFPPNGR